MAPAGLTWSRRAWHEETAELEGKPWWRNYRLLAGALVAVTAVMGWLFA